MVSHRVVVGGVVLRGVGSSDFVRRYNTTMGMRVLMNVTHLSSKVNRICLLIILYSRCSGDVGIMMEKEIKAYGDRKDTIIRFVKTDKVQLGKVYVLYPNEYDGLKTKIADLELELAIQKSKNKDLKEELQSNSNNVDYTEILDKLGSIEQRLDSLESKIKK